MKVRPGTHSKTQIALPGRETRQEWAKSKLRARLVPCLHPKAHSRGGAGSGHPQSFKPRTNNTAPFPILYCESREWPHGGSHVYNVEVVLDCSLPATLHLDTYVNRHRLRATPDVLTMTQPRHNATHMEYQLLGEIQRLRKELNEAMGYLHTEEADIRGFHEQLQDTRTELMVVHEKLAAVLVKKEQCGCKCCGEGVRMHVDLQVSHPPCVRCATVY